MIERQQNEENRRAPVLLLGVLGFVAVLVVLQALGIFKTLDTQRETVSVDVHSQEYMNKKMKPRRTEQPNAEVEGTINEIAQELQGPVFSDIRTANTQRGWGLSNDEARYYDVLKKQLDTKNTNWLTEARNAFQLYKMVQSIVSPEGTPVAQSSADPARSQILINAVSQYFKIPITETAAFANQQKPQNISDWALFVRSYK